MELHTFSSLNETFLLEYNNSMQEADEAIVYFNPHTIAHKKLKEISVEQITNAFGAGKNLSIYTDIDMLEAHLLKMNSSNSNLLMMSSGTFDGIDFTALANKIYGS